MNVSNSSGTENYLGPVRYSVTDYPSASNRKLILMRSQLNLAILVNLENVVRAILPHAIQQNRQIQFQQTTVYLDHEINSYFPGGISNPGCWMRGSFSSATPEIGSTLTSLYARIRDVPDADAEDVLRNHLEISSPEAFVKNERLRGWMWDVRPLSVPQSPPYPNLPCDSLREYVGQTRLPILFAVQQRDLSGVFIHYYCLVRRKKDPAGHWIEALPPGELPLFSLYPMFPGSRCPVRIVPSEFDPRFYSPGASESFCAVPGGAANLHRTDLKALVGCKVYLELLPDELAYTPSIIDALSRSKAAEVTVSLIGGHEMFPLKRLREVAYRQGFSFPPPVLPASIMDSAFIAAGSPLPPSSNPRRMVLEPVIAEEGLTWLYANPKMGKTWIALSIAQVASQGGSLGPWKAPEPASVLYIDGEMHPNDLNAAIGKVARGQEDHGVLRFDVLCAKLTKRGVINLLDSEDQQEIKKLAKGKSLVIFDPLYMLTSNIAADFMKVLEFFQELRAQGSAVLAIDHANGEGFLQGSLNKSRGTETLIELREPEGRDRLEKSVAIEVIRSRHNIPATAEYFVGKMVFTQETFNFEIEKPDVGMAREPIPAEIAKLAPIVIARDIDGLSFPKIQEQLGIARSTASDWYKKAKSLMGADREALEQEVQRLLDTRKAAE